MIFTHYCLLQLELELELELEMDDELICNYKDCRKRLKTFAWVRNNSTLISTYPHTHNALLLLLQVTSCSRIQHMHALATE